MKKYALAIMVALPIILSPIIIIMLSVGISATSGKVVGSIGLPIFELPFILLYILIIKKIWKFNFGFRTKIKPIPFMAIISMLAIVLVNIITSKSMDVIFNVLPSGQIFLAVIVAFFSSLVIGIFEEVVFRGVMFNYFVFLFRKSNKSILLAGLLSSIIFGLLHIINALYGGAEWAYTLYQVAYASALGFLFAMVYVQTKNIVAPILLHMLIDWSDLFFNIAGEPSMSGVSWSPIILTIIFVISGALLYRNIEINTLSTIGFSD